MLPGVSAILHPRRFDQEDGKNNGNASSALQVLIFPAAPLFFTPYAMPDQRWLILDLGVIFWYHSCRHV